LWEFPQEKSLAALGSGPNRNFLRLYGIRNPLQENSFGALAGASPNRKAG
jgi:hypothetical protein